MFYLSVDRYMCVCLHMCVFTSGCAYLCACVCAVMYPLVSKRVEDIISTSSIIPKYHDIHCFLLLLFCFVILCEAGFLGGLDLNK